MPNPFVVTSWKCSNKIDFLKYFSYIFDELDPACQIIDTIHNCYRSDPTCQGKKMKLEDEVDGNRNLPRDFFIFLIYFGILFLLFIVVLYFLRRKTVKKSTTRKACSTVSNQQWKKYKWNRSHKIISSFQYELTHKPPCYCNTQKIESVCFHWGKDEG